MMKKLLIFLFAISVTTFTLAQKSIIRGAIIEDSNGEPMFGVTVVIKGTTNGAVTDFDGKFEIKVEPGTYDLSATFVSFNSITITGVIVKENEVTVLDNVRMTEDVKTLEEVIVTGESLKDSETAILTMKRKSANVIDGISSANFRKIGDSDAASAMKRVTGVSVEGGKYVFVRGLGDRYTKTVLNDVDIPGLDPDRNSLQMDIFPTNVINNIIVLKSFTAELPADFTGGIINIETKEFPEVKTFKVGVGLGFNPSMHFQDDYLDYEGGKTDFLGFDDGTREIPWDRDDAENVPLYVNALGSDARAAQYEQMQRDFNPRMAALEQQSFMNYDVSASFGNQSAKEIGTLGYNVALTYKSNTEFYRNAEFGRWGLNQDDPNDKELDPRELQTGNYGIKNILLGGMTGVALKTKQSKYKINLLHLQNGESKAGIFRFDNSDQGAVFTAIQHNLEYSQRSLTNLLFNGIHYSQDTRWILDWKVSPTVSVMNDPDIRYTRYRDENDRLTIGTESGLPSRLWRYLNEQALASKVDATRETLLFGDDAKIKFGASNTYKARNYEILSFQILQPLATVDLTGNPDELFQPDWLFIRDELATGNSLGERGIRTEAEFQNNNPNQFDANINVTGAYSSFDFNILPKLKTITGIRVERYVQRYTGSNQIRSKVLDNEVVIDDIDLFPTANLIYAVTEMQNIRLSYSRTIARPSFKEASFAEIFDPLTGRTYIGSFFEDKDPNTDEVIWDGNIQATRIHNFDFRYEIFFKKGQTISLSGFYKSFENPIEIVQYSSAAGSFQPRNVGNGDVTGVEIEARQNLAFINPTLSVFMLNGNFTYAYSQIKMNPIEFESRVANARTGQSVTDTRQMAGQAPYIFNGGVSYSGEKSKIEAGIFYNVQGPTLLFVGITDRPDIFTVPFHSLNFNSSYTFGENDRVSVGFKINNILNDNREEEFNSVGGADRYFTRLSPGREFSTSLSYTF